LVVPSVTHTQSHGTQGHQPPTSTTHTKVVDQVHYWPPYYKGEVHQARKLESILTWQGPKELTTKGSSRKKTGSLYFTWQWPSFWTQPGCSEQTHAWVYFPSLFAKQQNPSKITNPVTQL
jgi:hypothetical protein